MGANAGIGQQFDESQEAVVVEHYTRRKAGCKLEGFTEVHRQFRKIEIDDHPADVVALSGKLPERYPGWHEGEMSDSPSRGGRHGLCRAERRQKHFRAAADLLQDRGQSRPV
ncbi:hypothetical protein [Mesorhizobium argentiipisi]|uniref:Uncharacterized protein n=1 Tax=Mesorhizobium argentiipisi TaxID=3015175 RepID=A0ABU8K5C6_9HYPH